MRGKIVFPRMGFRKALGKNTSSSYHVLFPVREIGPWKEYLRYILCLSSTNMADVSAIIWLYKQHHLRLLNTVRRTHCTDTTRNRMQTDTQVLKSMFSFGTMVYPAIRSDCNNAD